MKVLIPTIDENATLSSTPSFVLGSAKSFLIYDTQEDNFATIENNFFDDKHVDLGIVLNELGVDNIISSRICKTCYANIKKAGIETWKDDESVTIREAYQKFTFGGLFLMTDAGNFKLHKKRDVSPIPEELMDEHSRQRLTTEE